MAVEDKEVLIGLLKTLLDGEANTSSVEIGTAGKGGALKFKFNASESEDARKLCDNAIGVLKYARQEMDKLNGGAPQ